MLVSHLTASSDTVPYTWNTFLHLFIYLHPQASVKIRVKYYLLEAFPPLTQTGLVTCSEQQNAVKVMCWGF